MGLDSEHSKARLEKLEKLRAGGFGYPNTTKVTASTDKIRAFQEGAVSEPMTVAGRIIRLRRMGKASFFHLQDRAGAGQIYLSKNDLPAEEYSEFENCDIGDVVAVSGSPFLTKTGEPTVSASSFRILTKGLHPLPEKWHGLSDIETRYRQRYLDLIANPDVGEIFKKRATIIREIRSYLDENGFLEVETPILHHIAGGATARPFETHYNVLNADMFLRIALELPLKKLIVGGLERVYEIGRNFRNEGLSKKHNPEFTMLEFYEAYATFHDLMDRTEELFNRLVKKVCGSTEISYQGKALSFRSPWKRLSMSESLYELGGVSRQYDVDSLDDLKKIAKERSIPLREPSDWGRTLEDLWGELVEPAIWDPVFITHHPLSISPLARRSDHDPRVTDRFELIVAGMEMANAFSELNDAVDQRQRFEEQAQRHAAGDLEMAAVDEDFLTALEYGMPPTAGQGVGIDRLTMLLTDSSNIREVLLFPQLKIAETAQNED